jgi:acetyl-CoA synthetase
MADKKEEKLDALLQENRKFPPSAEFRAQANANSEEIYERARKDPEGFWEA